MKFNLPSIGNISLDMLPNLFTEVIRFLTEINNGRLTVVENIISSEVKATALSGSEVKVQHNLKNIPSVIVLTSGRVQMCSISNKTASNFIFRTKLLSTFSLNTIGDFVDRFEVEDASLFEVGDRLMIRDMEVTLKNKQNNVLTINKNIRLVGPTTITLAQDNCTFFLM